MSRVRCSSISIRDGSAFDAIQAAPLLIATSTYSGRRDGACYRASFWLDSWHEQYTDSPQCIGNHRTHDAAVNCALRYARLDGLRCLTLDQHDPQMPAWVDGMALLNSMR